MWDMDRYLSTIRLYKKRILAVSTTPPKLFFLREQLENSMLIPKEASSIGGHLIQHA